MRTTDHRPHQPKAEFRFQLKHPQPMVNCGTTSPWPKQPLPNDPNKVPAFQFVNEWQEGFLLGYLLVLIPNGCDTSYGPSLSSEGQQVLL